MDKISRNVSRNAEAPKPEGTKICANFLNCSLPTRQNEKSWKIVLFCEVGHQLCIPGSKGKYVVAKAVKASQFELPNIITVRMS